MSAELIELAGVSEAAKLRFEAALNALTNVMTAALPAEPDDDPFADVFDTGPTLTDLSERRLWHPWRIEMKAGKDGREKPRKVPYAINGGPGSSTDPTRWGTRAEAEAARKLLKDGRESGVGIVLGHPMDDECCIGGIDLDTCRDATGSLTPWGKTVVKTLGTYTEVSPSGTGVKTFFAYRKVDRPRLLAVLKKDGKERYGRAFKRRGDGGAHPPAIELYLGKRWFAVTDQRLPGSPAALITVPVQTLLKLINTTGPAFAAGQEIGRVSDQSRSGRALALAGRIYRAGGTKEQFEEALIDDADGEGLTAWADDQRQVDRAWDEATRGTPADNRTTTIQIVAGELHTATTAAEQALIDAGLPLYTRGGTIVRPIVEDVDASHDRKTRTVRLVSVSNDYLLYKMSEVARFERWDARSTKLVSIDPPPKIAATLLARDGEWKFPRLAGVINTQTLRPDGSLLDKPGYDTATALLLVDPPRMPAIPNEPTFDDAVAALGWLDGLLTEVPFVDEPSRSVGRSILITPVVRGAMPLAPLQIASAPAMGSSKSHLMDTASAIATGQLCPVIAAGRNEEETEKRLASVLMTGQSIVSIDNCNGELGGDFICMAVERPVVEVRILGRSEKVRLENRATMFATGINMTVRADLVRRTLKASLDANVERPEQRVFSDDPLKRILDDRGRYVGAALTIVRAYIAAGSPDPCVPLISFAPWSNMVRSALVWLGCADPVLTIEDSRRDDPETSILREVVAAWFDAVGANSPRSVGELIKIAEGQSTTAVFDGDADQPLLEVFRKVTAGDFTINPFRLGKWLSRYKGRIVDGLKLTATEDKKTKSLKWALCQ